MGVVGSGDFRSHEVTAINKLRLRKEIQPFMSVRKMPKSGRRDKR